MKIRIGFGFDVHQLTENHNLFLGGIKIPAKKGSLAYSDGDILIHAICDALLGAANLRDIGYHFPDTNNEYKNIDSKILLERTYNLLKNNNYKLGNIDCTVCMQNPKISEFIPDMQKTLAKILNSETENISIKATTTEKLGYIGRGEGISAYCVAFIEKI